MEELRVDASRLLSQALSKGVKLERREVKSVEEVLALCSTLLVSVRLDLKMSEIQTCIQRGVRQFLSQNQKRR